MKSLTGGALLLVLGVPLALYAALAVKAVARADLAGGDPPADRGASRDDLAKLRAKAGNWLGEVRKAATVAGLYRAAGSDDASSERTVAAAVAAASDRAKNLLDVDKFLSNAPDPQFGGKLAAALDKWHAGRAQLVPAERAVVQWLDSPPPVTSAATAKEAMDRALELIAQYAQSSPQFANGARAAVWRAQARLRVVRQLAAVADEQYQKAVQPKPPDGPAPDGPKGLLNGPATETLRSLEELGKQVRELATDVERAAEALPAEARKEADALKALAEDAAARKALLGLFAQEGLFVAPGGAAAWLKGVGEQYRRTTDPRTRALIRDKVQEFCAQFLAPAALLDDVVLLNNKPVARSAVRVGYEPRAGADTVFQNLSPAADGLNELTLPVKPPGVNVYLAYDMSTWDVKKLGPTDLSKAAVEYNAARAKVDAAPGRTKWTPNSLAELKKACEAKKDSVDQLKVPGGGAVPRLAVRVASAAEGASANPDLFGDQ